MVLIQDKRETRNEDVGITKVELIKVEKYFFPSTDCMKIMITISVILFIENLHNVNKKKNCILNYKTKKIRKYL